MQRRATVFAVRVYLIVVVIGLSSWLSAYDSWIGIREPVHASAWLLTMSRFAIGLAPILLLPAVSAALWRVVRDDGRPRVVSGKVIESELLSPAPGDAKAPTTLRLRYSFRSRSGASITAEATFPWRYPDRTVPPPAGTRIAVLVEDDGLFSLL